MFGDVYIVLALLFFALPQTTTGVSMNQIATNLLMLVITFLFTLSAIGPIVRTMLMDKLLLLFIVYVLLTVLWTASVPATIVTELKFITATLFGFYLCSKCTMESFFKYLFIFFAVSAVLSFGAGILFPQYTIHHSDVHSGEWKGIFGHKNGLGTICVLAISAMQLKLLSHATAREKRFAAILLVAYVILLILASSRTAFVVAIICAAIPFVYKIYRKQYTIHRSLFLSYLCIGIVLAAATAQVVMSNLDYLFEIMNRTPELTGRTEIWAVVRVYIHHRMWFGYGFGGFWFGNFSLEVWNILNFPGLTSSHSGFYDFLLDFGVVGLIIFAGQFLLLLKRASTLILSNQNHASTMWFFLFALFIVINNYSDSRLLNTTSIFWVLYLSVSILTKKQMLANPGYGDEHSESQNSLFEKFLK